MMMRGDKMANQPLQVIKTVSSLPVPLAPNVIYLVRVDQGYDLYATDTTGSSAYKINVSPSQLTNAISIANGGTGATTLAAAQTALGVDKVVSANTRLTAKKQDFPNVFVDNNGQLQKTQLATWLDHAKMYNGLFPNGSFQMGDATGWHLADSSALSYITNDFPFGAQGALQYDSTASNFVLTLDKIPVNPYMPYRLACSFKYEKVNRNSELLAGMKCFDVDGNDIQYQNAYHSANTVTTLAQDLKIGDTKVYLTSLANWKATAGALSAGFKFYNYVDSRGYLYKPNIMPYSRYLSPTDMWNSVAGSFDTTNNIITLNKPWNYANPKDANGTWLAGTQVAQQVNGATWQFNLKDSWMANQTGTTEWDFVQVQISGISISSGNHTTFRPGTAYIAPFFWFRNSSTGDITKISNLYFEKI